MRVDVVLLCSANSNSTIIIQHTSWRCVDLSTEFAFCHVHNFFGCLSKCDFNLKGTDFCVRCFDESVCTITKNKSSDEEYLVAECFGLLLCAIDDQVRLNNNPAPVSPCLVWLQWRVQAERLNWNLVVWTGAKIGTINANVSDTQVTTTNVWSTSYSRFSLWHFIAFCCVRSRLR